MGQEVECTLRLQRRNLAGKAYLETDFILFRPQSESKADRLKIAFRDLKSVSAAGGVLTLAFEGGPAALDLGPAAEKWAHKILHPPSRLDKLGIKAGLSVRLSGEFDAAFLDELRAREIAWREGPAKAKSDIILYAAASAGDLKRIPRLMTAMQPDGAIWVIYPKGVTTIREIDVIQSGRENGLKDVKVAGFSTTHTALKFVVPLSSR